MIRRQRVYRRMARRRPVVTYHHHRPAIPHQLVEAHRLYEAGEFEPAAGLYRELAEKAAERGYPQAANLYLRSADSFLKAGQPGEVLEMVFNGLGILIKHKKWLQLKRVSSLTVDRLRVEGEGKLARQVEDWIEIQVPERIRGSEIWVMEGADARSGSHQLPSSCGQCGGPVDPGQVEWHDPRHPVCAFCGAGLNSN